MVAPANQRWGKTMSDRDRQFLCACVAAGKPLLCRSCQRRAGLQRRDSRTAYQAALYSGPPERSQPRAVRG